MTFTGAAHTSCPQRASNGCPQHSLAADTPSTIKFSGRREVGCAFAAPSDPGMNQSAFLFDHPGAEIGVVGLVYCGPRNGRRLLPCPCKNPPCGGRLSDRRMRVRQRVRCAADEVIGIR